MYLSISARFTFKDRPKGRKGMGITSEQWAWGRDGPVPFAALCESLIITTLEYYLRLHDAAILNAELDKLRSWLAGIHIDEELPEEAPDDLAR